VSSEYCLHLLPSMLISRVDDDIVIAITSGQVVVTSGTISACRDEARLAFVLATEIACAVTKLRSESLSNYFLARAAALPAVQFIVTALFLPSVWYVAIPYLCLYGTYLQSQRGSLLREHLEADYIGLLTLHRAGFDMNAGLELRIEDLKVREDMLEKFLGQVTAVEKKLGEVRIVKRC